MSSSAPRHASANAAARAVEREVRGNVLGQAFGVGTVADLNLPEEFIRRCADRVIVSSFNERHRIVVGDAPPRAEQVQPPFEPPSPHSAGVRVLEGASMRDRRWSELPTQTTAVLRGFAFPHGDGGGAPGLPGPAEPYELRRAAAVISKNLARNGLPATALEAAVAMRPLLGAGCGAVAVGSLLRRAGLPVDLLAVFEAPGSGGFARGGCVDWLAARLAEGKHSPSAAIRAVLGGASAKFRPTLNTFRASSDSGGAEPHLIRLQLTRGDDWLGGGDGGALDIARQAAAMFPGIPMLLTARQDHAESARRHAAEWARAGCRTAPITVIAESVTVSQWAQDNARAGTVESGGVRGPAALLPRYASRAEEFTAFVPGDTICAESLGEAGVTVARSPLHFQGGNTMVVDDRANRRRVLLIGEAEVYRNIGLGLTREQAIDALRVEFFSDEAVVLPAASYHIDYEVLCVTSPSTGRVTAFVGDQAWGAGVVVAAGLAVLEHAGMIDASTRERIEATTAAGSPDAAAIERVFGAIGREVPARGGFPLELANRYTQDTPGESEVGNFLLFVDALDSLAARAGLGSDPRVPGHAAAAMSARLRMEADREEVRRVFEGLGWEVRALPSHTAGPRSTCPLNGVVLGGSVVIPTVSGLFGEVANLAADRIVEAIPEIQVRKTGAAESLRRNGGVRCAMSVF